MSAVQHAAVPRSGPLQSVERAAWAIPLPTRRLFATLAVVVGLVLG